MNTLPAPVPTGHAGLDVAKATLQLHLQGHHQTVKLRRAVPDAHLACDGTAGYEQPLVAALHADEIPVSIVSLARVWHFAQA